MPLPFVAPKMHLPFNVQIIQCPQPISLGQDYFGSIRCMQLVIVKHYSLTPHPIVLLFVALVNSIVNDYNRASISNYRRPTYVLLRMMWLLKSSLDL